MAEGADTIETRDYSDLPPVELVAPATIGAVAILLIVLGSIAACIIAAVCITTGGVLIARKATYKVDQNDLSGEIVEMVAVPKGQEFVPDDEWVAKRMSSVDMVGFNPMNRHLGPRSSVFEAGKARNAVRMRGSQLAALRSEMDTLGEMAFADHEATDESASSEDFVNPMLMMATLNSAGGGQPHGNPMRASANANSAQRAPESSAGPPARGVEGSAPEAQGANSSPAAALGLEAKKSMRVDRDGSVYSKDDFRKYYGGEDEWNTAMRTGAGGAARHAIAEHAYENEEAPGSPRFDFGRLTGRRARSVAVSGVQVRDPNYRYISCESFSPFDLLPLTSSWSRGLPCMLQSERPSRSRENARTRAIHSEIDGASFGAIAAAAAVAHRALSESASFIGSRDSGSDSGGPTGSDEQRKDVGGGIRGAMSREQSMRSDANGAVYTRAQFAEHYGGEDEWNAARRRSGSRNGSRQTSVRLGVDEALASDPSESDSIEEDASERRYDVGRSMLSVLKSKKSMRADADGAVYSRQDFIDFYGGTSEWDAAKRMQIHGAARRASGAASAAAAAAALCAAEFDDSLDETRAAEEADAIDEAAAVLGTTASPRSREPSEDGAHAIFSPPEEESDDAPQFGAEDDRRPPMSEGRNRSGNVEGDGDLPPPMADDRPPHVGDMRTGGDESMFSPIDEGRASPASDEAPGWASLELQGEGALSGRGHIDGDVERPPPDGESGSSAVAALSPPHGESDDAPQWEAVDGDGLSEHGDGDSAPTMSFDM